MKSDKIIDQPHHKVKNIEKDCKEILYDIKGMGDTKDYSSLKSLGGHMKMARVLLERADNYHQQIQIIL